MEAIQLALFELPTPLDIATPKTLDLVLEFLNDIPDINAGGCGLAALAIFRWCKKNDVEVDDRPFVILCEDIEEVWHNNERYQEGDIAGMWKPHVATLINGDLVDSEGYDAQSTCDCFITQDFYLNEAELVELLNTSTWNDDFKRKLYRNDIAINLDINLSDVNYHHR